MAGPLVYGDSAEIVALPGTSLGWAILDQGQPAGFIPYHVTAQIVVAPEADDYPAFKLPDLYKYYPEIVRYLDTTYVDRGNIPLYYWDGGIRWDAEPVTWDEVIGPEPILKTTTRIMQMELEKTAHEIEDILGFYDAQRCAKELLPYHAALLGTPLPAAKESQQRAFLEALGQTYRKKGTPLSFARLFESLGFTLLLQENYQRKADGGFATGPQMDRVSTNHVISEPVGTTSATTVSYTFQFVYTPVARGSIKLRIYGESTVTPTIVKDNGDGSWANGWSGSIDYVHGVATLTLPAFPSLAGQPIEADYYYLPDAFPDPYDERWTNRWRSSVVYVGLVPNDSSVALTTELNNRLLLYLNLLKPAHVIVQALEVIFQFSEDEGANMSDEIPGFAYLHAESLYGTLYLGAGWAAQDNGSLNPAPAYVGQQHRDGNEFLTRWDLAPNSGPWENPADAGYPSQDLTRTPPPPYTYPFHMGGLFTQPPPSGEQYTNIGFSIAGAAGQRATLGSVTTDLTAVLDVGERFFLDGFVDPDDNGQWVVLTAPAGAGPWTVLAEKISAGVPGNEAAGATVTLTEDGDVREAVWIDSTTYPNLAGLVTADVAATTTRCTMVKGVGAAIAVGDHIIFTDGPSGGESRIISVFADGGAFYDVQWVTPLPFAADVGDTAYLLGVESVNLRNLQTGYRQQDPLDLYFIEPLYSPTRGTAPNGVALVFTGELATKVPIEDDTDLPKVTLSFTIGAADFTETDDGAGGWTNVNGHLDGAGTNAINYATGAVDLEFLVLHEPDAGSSITVTYPAAATLDLGEF